MLSKITLVPILACLLIILTFLTTFSYASTVKPAEPVVYPQAGCRCCLWDYTKALISCARVCCGDKCC
ncbi:hypothetical protein CASFOL_028587 [Castilleja foliolosa]|uniref:Transmembrane protein n=1 Tax=Castilleja foliolosa TaxID=1961234 RepID=A0ABD3CCD7_9LAMI